MANLFDLNSLFDAAPGANYQKACAEKLDHLIQQVPELLEKHIFHSDKLNPTDLLHESLTLLIETKPDKEDYISAKKQLDCPWNNLELHLKHYSCKPIDNQPHLNNLITLLHSPDKRTTTDILDKFKLLIQRATGDYESFLIHRLNIFLNNCISKEEKLNSQQKINKIFTENVIAQLRDADGLPKKIKQQIYNLINNLNYINNPEELITCLMDLNQTLIKIIKKNKKHKVTLQNIIKQQDKIFCWLNESREDKLQFIHPQYTPESKLFLDLLIKHYLTEIRDISKKHNKKLNRFLRRKWNSTKELCNYFWHDFFETPDVSEKKTAHKYWTEAQRLLDYKENPDESDVKDEDDYRNKFFALVEKIGVNYVMDRNFEYGYRHDYPFTIKMRNLLNNMKKGFLEKQHVQKTLNKTLRGCLNGDLKYYIDRRKNKSLYHHSRIDTSAIGYILSDIFHIGGKRHRKNKKTYDSRNHRIDACRRLNDKLTPCENVNDYIGYIAQCLFELQNIHTDSSQLKKILRDHIIQIVNEIIIPNAAPHELGITYQLLYPVLKGSMKRRLTHFTQFVGEHPHVQVKEEINAQEHAKRIQLSRKLIHSYLKKNPSIPISSIDKKDQGTMDLIKQNIALNTFYRYAQNSFNSLLLTYKVASTGKLKTKEKNLGTLAQWIPSIANKAAGAVGLGAIAGAGGILSDVLQYADRKTRSAEFKSLKDLLQNTENIDIISHHVMKDYTKIWQNQIIEMAKGDLNNVKIFADCIIERVMHYLTNEIYANYPQIPIEKQLCYAARTQRIRHTLWKTRLATENCTNQFNDKAFIVEEMFDVTPIKADNGTIYTPPHVKDKYGIALDGKEAAELLHFTQTRDIDNKAQILSSPYKNTPMPKAKPIPQSPPKHSTEQRLAAMEKELQTLKKWIQRHHPEATTDAFLSVQIPSSPNYSMTPLHANAPRTFLTSQWHTPKKPSSSQFQSQNPPPIPSQV